MKRTMQKPKVTQVPMRPSAGSAHVKSPSQVRVSASSPTARSAWLSGPSGA